MALTPDMMIAAAFGLGLGLFVGFFVFRFSLLQKISQLTAEKDSAEKRIAQSESELEKLEARFALQFENLANKIFEDKSAKFKKESQEGLGQLLNPLRERLQEFQKKVDDSFGLQAKEQFSLKNEIKNIVAANERMSLQTESLTKALKGDVKVQGNWGEMILEKILEDSGLRKGHNYDTQGADMGLKHAETGGHMKPDVIISLPDGKKLIIDAKVSLTHYERYCAATDEAEREQSLKQHLNAVRTRVNELAEKRYHDMAGLETLDFVMMFMPIEGAYALAVQQDRDLHSFAWNKKVVIVCPTTLWATLRTVDSVWRLENQNKNAQEIAAKGGALYDKIVGFVSDMEDIGKKINATQKTYDDAIGKLKDGKGNVLRQAEQLRDMGVKTNKTLPRHLLDTDETAAENNIETIRVLK